MEILEIKEKHRSKFASTINYRKMPVLRLDLAKSSDLHAGEARAVYKEDCNGKTAFEEVRLNWYDKHGDDYPARLSFGSSTCCIHKDFTYHDAVELLNRSAMPCLELGGEFMLVIEDTQRGAIYGAAILKMATIRRRFCSEPIDVDPQDNMEFSEHFGDLLRAYIKK